MLFVNFHGMLLQGRLLCVELPANTTLVRLISPFHMKFQVVKRASICGHFFDMLDQVLFQSEYFIANTVAFVVNSSRTVLGDGLLFEESTCKRLSSPAGFVFCETDR